MTRILRQAPLIEAACEFHLDVPDWDWTIPGVVYRRIKDRFPRKVEATDVNFRVDQTPEGLHSSTQAGIGRMQFWSSDNRQLVQIGPQQLSIHQLQPYSGWPAFKALIEQILGEYESEAPFQAIRGASLRYVNQLPLPYETYKYEHLVNVMPQIPDSSDQIWASWFQQVEIFQEQNQAVLGVRSGHIPQVLPEAPTSPAPAQHILLDLLFSHAGLQPIERASVSSWLDMAHQEIETLFFKSLQPEYLKTFEPEVDNENAS